MSAKKQDFKQIGLGWSNKKPMKFSVKPKRTAEQFNPGLYITRELSQSDVMLIKQAYDYHDSNGMGLLTPNDLKQALFNMGFFASKETVYNLIAECDEQGLGGLTFDAFVRVVGTNPAQTQNSNDLKKIFRKYDKQNKGFIVAADLISIAKSLGQLMSQQQGKALFQILDQKGQGKIQFQQFCLLMHHPQSLK